MLFMQTHSDRFGQSPRQIQKSSLSKPGIIPFLSTKTPSENHLPKQCGFSQFGEYNEVLNLLTLFIPQFFKYVKRSSAFKDTKNTSRKYPTNAHYHIFLSKLKGPLQTCKSFYILPILPVKIMKACSFMDTILPQLNAFERHHDQCL